MPLNFRQTKFSDLVKDIIKFIRYMVLCTISMVITFWHEAISEEPLILVFFILSFVIYNKLFFRLAEC